MPALGHVPNRIDVNLVHGDDFVDYIGFDDGSPVPDTAVVTLHLGDDHHWVGTHLDGQITWNVDKAVVETVPDREPSPSGRNLGCRITYVDGSTDLTWSTGRVYWHG